MSCFPKAYESGSYFTDIKVKEIQDKELIKELDKIFKNEEAQELFEEINNERTAIISAAKSGEYDITSGVWFTMLSEKINIIAQAEDLLSSAMNKRSQKIQDETLRVLILTFTVWFISIILAILGYILSNEIAKNIKNLEHVLEKVTGDYDSKERKIKTNLATF